MADEAITETTDQYLAREVKGTREKLIQCAMRLYYLNGINAVGLDRIIAEVGVTKTTFYNHFQSKDELTIEVLRRRGYQESNQLRREIREIGGDDARAQLEAIFTVLDEWFNSEMFHGCQYTNAAAEFPSPHDPVHQAAAEYKTNEVELICGLARAAGIAKSREFTSQMMLVIEGCISWRLITADEKSAQSAAMLARELIDRYLADSTSSIEQENCSSTEAAE